MSVEHKQKTFIGTGDNHRALPFEDQLQTPTDPVASAYSILTVQVTCVALCMML